MKLQDLRTTEFLDRAGYIDTIVVHGDGETEFRNVAAALAEPGTDLRVFAKPEVHGHRRMAVALAVGGDETDARAKAGNVAESLDIAIV